MSAYIYKLSFYASPLHSVSHNDKYYLEPHHTYWALQIDENVHEMFKECRITIIKVSTDSFEYRIAVKLSQIYNDYIVWATDKIKIATLQATEQLCPDVQRIILEKVTKDNFIKHPELVLRTRGILPLTFYPDLTNNTPWNVTATDALEIELQAEKDKVALLEARILALENRMSNQ